MIHDGVTGPARQSARTGHAGTERRAADRAPLPAEITLRWLHDPETLLRVAVLDVSNDGYRIRTTLPTRTGATAIALRLLPTGEVLDHVVVAIWCASTPHNDGYEIGLRRI